MMEYAHLEQNKQSYKPDFCRQLGGLRETFQSWLEAPLERALHQARR